MGETSKTVETMFEEIIHNYKKFVEYGVYLLVLLTMLDGISTYLGITYFDAYEANRKAAYLFNAFGIILPSFLKLFIVIALGYVIKIVWKNSEFLLSRKSGWLLALASSLNIMILSLNAVYFMTVVHNITLIYNY